MRKCGECTLCCRLVPVVEMSTLLTLDKPAGQKCKYQCSKGCRIYNEPSFPTACRQWSCQWQVGLLPIGMKRPDRCGYVVDTQPDRVVFVKEDGEKINIPVVQVWVDPHRIKTKTFTFDRNFKLLMEKVKAIGWGLIIRENARDGFAMVWMENQWVIKRGEARVLNSAEDVLELWRANPGFEWFIGGPTLTAELR